MQRIRRAMLVNSVLRTSRGARNVRTILRHLGVIGIFSIPAVAIFWHAWDGHLASTATCACSDAGQQIWFTAWPAYALLHGLNPFFTSKLWAPQGTNLLLNTSGPLIGVVFAPVTWRWGPVASTNLALTLAPALSSWACWVACRRFVSWPWAAWVAGPLFGYSPFVFSNLRQGHLTLGVLVIPPLMLVVFDEILSKQRGAAWSWGVALGLLAVAQFLISPEVLAMACLVALIGVCALAILSAGSSFRQHIRHALQSLGVALGVAAVLLAVPAWFALAGPRHIKGTIWPGLNGFGINLNDLWDQSSAVAFGVPTGHSAANLGVTGPNPAYLGFGTLVVVVLSILLARRRRTAWVLLVVAIGSCTLSLGSAVFRHDALAWLSWLPWQTLGNWPLLDDVLPGRFSLFTDLALAVLVAIGLDEAHRWFAGRSQAPDRALGSYRRRVVALGRRWGKQVGPPLLLCAVAASVFVPIWGLYSIPTASEVVKLPPWFAVVGPTVPTGSVILTYPFPASASLASEPMIWQAVDDMRFSLAGGYVKVPGSNGRILQTGASGSAVNSLITLTVVPQTPKRSWDPTPTELVRLRSELSRWNISYIVITATGLNPVYTAAVMTALTGRLPQTSHRAWVWDLRATPLTARFDAVAAASAFRKCLSTAELYQHVPAHHEVPQGGNLCVSKALVTETKPFFGQTSS
jgi:hypothetical protein